MDVHPLPLGAIAEGTRTSPAGVVIRVDVDRNHCHRLAICEQEAPEVFRLSADGRLHYTSRPSIEHRDAVRQAARLCPMQAITIQERPR